VLGEAGHRVSTDEDVAWRNEKSESGEDLISHEAAYLKEADIDEVN
jgi:hypothetical protein